VVDTDLMQALRNSYQEVQSRKRLGTRLGSVSSLRRYLIYLVDLLDIAVNIQRDRRWNHDD